MTVLPLHTQQSNIVCNVVFNVHPEGRLMIGTGYGWDYKRIAVAVDKINCWWKQTTFFFSLHNCNGAANNFTAAPE